MHTLINQLQNLSQLSIEQIYKIGKIEIFFKTFVKSSNCTPGHSAGGGKWKLQFTLNSVHECS